MADLPLEQLHVPVLVEEVLNNLIWSTSGTYVDATFGRGGHTRAILEALGENARVIALDRDPEAVSAGEDLARKSDRLTVCHACFSDLSRCLADLGIEEVAGILMDLGVSSPQLDEAERGFSFMADGPLDMRMDPGSGFSAAQWLNTAAEAEIAGALREFGEERHARRIARGIIAARPLSRTAELADVVAQAIPRAARNKHPATRTFQAVRMVVNAEAEELKQGLVAAFDLLEVGGRLAVISFQSLEDRVVKQTFRKWSRPEPMPRRLPVRHESLETPGREVAGPIRASAQEVDRNPRARSALLRVIEKRVMEKS